MTGPKSELETICDYLEVPYPALLFDMGASTSLARGVAKKLMELERRVEELEAK